MALGAVVALVACFLPAFQIAIEAYIGAGDEQRGFTYERELTLIRATPWSLLVPAGAVALLAVGALAVVKGDRPWLVAASCVIALLSLRASLGVVQALDWGDGVGVIGYEEPSGGRLLQPSIDELRDDARASPEAADPGWELLGGEHGFRARGLVGWQLLQPVIAGLALLTTYRTFRLFLRPTVAVSVTTAATLVVLVWLFLRALSGLE